MGILYCLLKDFGWITSEPQLGIQTGSEIEAMTLAQHSGVPLQDRRVLSSEIYVYPDQIVMYLSHKLCLKVHMQFGFAFQGTSYI